MPEQDRSADEARSAEAFSSLLGYQLHLTNLLALRGARATLERCHLTPAKVTALLFIRDNPGTAQSDLARFLAINRSSAMKLVDTLVERNHVRRAEGRDMRSHGIYLTGRGAASLKTAVSALVREDQILSGGLSVGERLELLRLLKKMRASANPERLSAATEERKVS